MIEMAFKNIWGRKVRSIMTILGIIIAMQLFIVLSSIMNSYEKDVQKQISGMAGRIMVQAKSDDGARLVPLENVIKEKDAQAVESIDNVDTQRSSMILFQSIVATNTPNMPPAVMAVGIEPGKEEAYFGNIKFDGQKSLRDDHDVILGASAAVWAEKEHKAKLGDNIKVKGETFKVIGILPSITSVVDSSFIIPLTTAQDIFVRPGVVSAVMLTAQNADEVDEIAENVTKTNSKLTASTSNEVKKSADEMLAGQRMFFAMINNTIVVVSAFIIMIVMVMAVFERKKEIGTLKAIGASRFKILKMIVTESLVLSMIGGLLALPTSLVFTWVISKSWYFDPQQWLQTVIVVAILGVLSGLLPAWSAQRVNPLESLRYE